MFDQLFERPHALARHRTAPLVEERLRYLAHLAGQGMAHTTLVETAIYLLIVVDQLDLTARPGQAIPLAEIQQQAILWADRPGQPAPFKGAGRSRVRFVYYATRFLCFLGRLQSPPSRPHPYADHIAAFADSMSRERGLSPLTIRQRCWQVEGFLERLGTRDQSLRGITLRPVDAALVQRVTDGRYARVTVPSLAHALRAFFRYAHGRGWCSGELATGIQAPRVYSLESLPTGPSWEDVQRLLATTATDHGTDIRDRAILMLLAVYGCRAGEVVRLRLEDFDWERELLSLTRGKTRRVQTFPLARPVGDAVLAYLQKVRPRSACREVFLTRQAPVRPLTSGALWHIVAPRLRALGVALPHHGPHALRPAWATHLLGQGLSLKEIGDHRGHQHPDSTRNYAKVDLAGLRQVADLDLGGLL